MRAVGAGVRDFGSGRRPLSAALVFVVALLTSVDAVPQPAARKPPPPTLQETGLYSDFAALAVDPRHLAFCAAIPALDRRRSEAALDFAAARQRDRRLRSGALGLSGRRRGSGRSSRSAVARVRRASSSVQPDGQWLYAAYAWSADGSEATLAPEAGRRGTYAFGGGRCAHDPGRRRLQGVPRGAAAARSSASARCSSRPTAIPMRCTLAGAGARCRPALPGRAGPASPDLPASLLTSRRGSTAASPTERAALGYLHGNCGHCHDPQRPLQNVGIFLRQHRARAFQPASRPPSAAR